MKIIILLFLVSCASKPLITTGSPLSPEFKEEVSIYLDQFEKDPNYSPEYKENFRNITITEGYFSPKMRKGFCLVKEKNDEHKGKELIINKYYFDFPNVNRYEVIAHGLSLCLIKKYSHSQILWQY